MKELSQQQMKKVAGGYTSTFQTYGPSYAVRQLTNYSAILVNRQSSNKFDAMQ